ncbi:MAG: exonuclease domain-containing protein [Candidatus Gracilibacteria bacterium]|jgi:DNA polymerase III epsilon subunit family exonuclease
MFVSLDLETTGIDPKRDRIIEFGAIKFDLKGHKKTFKTLINPGITLPQIITHITGIKDKDLENAPKFSEVKDKIVEFIGDLPIVGHNIRFDTDFLRNNGIEIKNAEYDTSQMVSTLFPSMPSYSLEVISEALKLKHEEKHRALDDSIAAMELFTSVLKKFQELPPELFEKVRTILNKSTWSLKDVLLELKPLKSRKTPKKKPAYSSQQSLFSEKPTGKTPDIEFILEEKENAIIEMVPPYSSVVKELLNKAHKDTLVAVPYRLFKEISRELPENIAQLDSPSNYISPSRLEEFIKKDSLEPHETTAIIKTLIWLNTTSTGHLSEVNYFNREKNIIPLINADDDFADLTNEKFVQKAIHNTNENAGICTHQFLLETSQTPAKKLIIADFENFTKSLHYSICFSASFNTATNVLEELKLGHENAAEIENLIAKTSILFGMMGMILEKYREESFFGERSVIDDNIRYLQEWKNVNLALSNITEITASLEKSEKTKPLFKKWDKLLGFLKEAIENASAKDEQIFLEKDEYDNIRIRRNKLGLNGHIKPFLEKCGQYILIMETADLNDKGKFIKTIFGLPENIKITKTPSTEILPEIFLANDCPENEHDNKYTVSNYLIKKLSKTKGKNAFVVPHNQMEFFTLKLKRILGEKEISVISHLTGSITKFYELFKSSDKNLLAIMTAPTWENLENVNEIKTLFVHKIPFDSTNNPYIASIAHGFKNAFIDFLVPHAIMNLKKILNRLPKDKKAIILDSRIVNKDYGKQIIENLPGMETFSVI